MSGGVGTPSVTTPHRSNPIASPGSPLTGDYIVTYYDRAMEELEPVFKALADPNRRLLLDKLHEQDGQTLLELQRHLPEMTRFGAMKHLKVLEEAGLVITRRSGREKHHFLNRVPIQLVYDRWVVKYARPWTRSLTGLKGFLEGAAMAETVSHLFEVYIRTSPEKLWQALKESSMTQQYFHGLSIDSEWKPGAGYRMASPTGELMIDGEILEIDPPRRLKMTFRAHWDEDAKLAAPSTITYTIEPAGDACKLTLMHEGLDPARTMAQSVRSGWSLILSSLKTLLETGEPLNASEM